VGNQEFEVRATATYFQAKCSVVRLGYMVILEHLPNPGLVKAKGAMRAVSRWDRFWRDLGLDG
jgi:hypothetical protein